MVATVVTRCGFSNGHGRESHNDLKAKERMEFHHFRDAYWAARDQGLLQDFWYDSTKLRGTPTAEEFYLQLEEDALQPQSIREFGENVLLMRSLAKSCKEWYRNGKPYVKIYPQMAAKLAKTSLDIPGNLLKMPFPSFEIRLPKTNNPFAASSTTREARSIFVLRDNWRFRLNSAKEFDQLAIWVDYGDSEDERLSNGEIYHQPTFAYVHIKLDTECTIAEGREQSYDSSFVVSDKHPTREELDALLSLTVSTAFFLAGQHQTVCPDIPTKLVEKLRKAQSDGDQGAVSEIMKKARKSGMGGYTLGREVELPRQQIEWSGDATHSFAQRFSHVRSGHLRMQAIGPRGSNQHKVIFIEPTAVRPDLPMKPSSGYVIRDSLLQGAV
jgi:hypothetical protein